MTILALMLICLGTELQGSQSPRATLPVVEYGSLVTTGQGRSSTLTLVNRSASEAAQGVVEIVRSDGSVMAGALPGAPTPFSIPPSGSLVLRTSGEGVAIEGYARVRSNVRTTIEVGADAAAGRESPTGGKPTPTTVARTVTLAVSIDRASGRDVRIGVLALEDAGTHLVVTAYDERGAPVPNGAVHLPFDKLAHRVGAISELIPALGAAPFRGTLTIERQWATFPGGRLAIAAVAVTSRTAAPIEPTIVR